MRSFFCFLDRPISWLFTYWIYGPRCTEFMPECCVCEEWARHDEMFGGG